MADNNPVNLQFPVSTTIYVTAVSNASYMQEVQITPPSGDPATFQGQGEGNVTMSLSTSGFLQSSTGGWASFTTSSNPSDMYSVAIAYSTSSAPPYTWTAENQVCTEL